MSFFEGKHTWLIMMAGLKQLESTSFQSLVDLKLKVPAEKNLANSHSGIWTFTWLSMIERGHNRGVIS